MFNLLNIIVFVESFIIDEVGAPSLLKMTSSLSSASMLLIGHVPKSMNLFSST